MDLQIVTWKIIGIRPLMQSNYVEMMSAQTETPELEGPKPRGQKKVRLKPFVEAQKQLYNSSGEYWHPSLAFWSCLCEHWVGFKIGGTAASSVLPRIMFPLDQEKFILHDPDTLNDKKPRKLKGDEWQMNSGRVFNVKVGGIIVHRPRWPKWGGFWSAEIDLEPFAKEEAKKAMLDAITDILNRAGRYGIGAGRMRYDEKRRRWGGPGLGKFRAERVT